MPPRIPSAATRFKRVAFQRFEDAAVLLANYRTTGAAYMAGYAVECALKALLLACTPVSRHSSLEEHFAGKKGHSLEKLQQALKKQGVVFPAEVLSRFIAIRTWATDLRYVPGIAPPGEAKAFVESADTILQWVGGRC